MRSYEYLIRLLLGAGLRFDEADALARELALKVRNIDAVIIDNHEWHIIVRLDYGRVHRQLRWRPLSLRNYQWSNVTTWEGPKPKDLLKRFAKFNKHIRMALQSEARRKEHADALRAGRPLPAPEPTKRGPYKTAAKLAETAARFAMARETLALRSQPST